MITMAATIATAPAATAKPGDGRRVAEYVRAIRAHPMLEGVGVFATMARAMPLDSRSAVSSHNLSIRENLN